ncbi:hypothetical protein AeRB84_013915, partial [Aphanomyces euteiches]
MGASDLPPGPPLANTTQLQPRPPAAPPDPAVPLHLQYARTAARRQSQRLRQRIQSKVVSPTAPLLAFDTNATVPTTPTTTSQSLGNHTDLLINLHEPPPPSLTAQADKPLPVCQALHPPVPPPPPPPPDSWLEEPYLQANSPARPFREHQHQRLFPLFQRALPILFPLFTSPSHTLSASPTSHQPILQSDASMPPTSTPPLAQAPPEQNQAAATSTPQPAASLPSLTEPRTIISMESYQKRKRDEDLNSTTARRVAPTVALVAAPSTLAFPQPAPTTTHAPTDTRTMADTHQDTDMQATEPQGPSQNQQPAGASPSPKWPGLEEIRDECHPPVPYANDSFFWEAEDELFPVLTDEEINNIETAFAQSTNMLVLHLNPDDAARYNIVNVREDITNDCKYFFNITFPTPLSGGTTTASTLMGTPIERHIEAWSAAKRGYMLLPKVMILVSYQHAAHIDPPQSLNQLEYSNTDYMSPNELRKAFHALG